MKRRMAEERWLYNWIYMLSICSMLGMLENRGVGQKVPNKVFGHQHLCPIIGHTESNWRRFEARISYEVDISGEASASQLFGKTVNLATAFVTLLPEHTAAIAPP